MNECRGLGFRELLAPHCTAPHSLLLLCFPSLHSILLSLDFHYSTPAPPQAPREGGREATMKHRHSMRKLGRTSAHRWALLRNLVSQLVQHERIETTVPKAKELRRVADNMVQLGKEGTLAARRRAASVIHGDENLHKVFSELAFRYKDRAGGYTRVLATRVRQGDAAPMAYIEFVDRPNELRESKPAATPPPPRVPLPPWLQSRHARCFAPADSGL